MTRSPNPLKSLQKAAAWLRPRIAGIFKITVAIVLMTATAIGVVAGFVAAANADLAGRSTMTERVAGWPMHYPHESDQIRQVINVTLVIHRLVEGENVAEASVIFTFNGVWASRESGLEKNKGYKLVVMDGSPLRAGSVLQRMEIPTSDDYQLTQESPVFLVPTLSSVGGFPFDSEEMYTEISVSASSGDPPDFYLDVEKDFPGRTLSVDLPRNGTPHIVLSRSPLTKILVVTSAIIFIGICALAAFWLVIDKTSLSGIEAVFAVAGFLIASGEFRGALSAQEAGDANAFQIGAWLVPLLLLSVVFSVATFRERLRNRAQGRRAITNREEDKHQRENGPVRRLEL